MAKKYLDLVGLTTYDTKIKQYADTSANSKANSAVSTHNSNAAAHATLLAGYVKTSTQVAGKPLTNNISAAELTSALTLATQSLQGLLSAADKKKLDDLWAIFDNGGSDEFVDTLTEILQIFENYPQGADLAAQLASKVDKNATITGGTNTKITYDAKGLITGSSAATLDDIPDGVSRKIPTIPNMVVNSTGTGEAVTTITVDATNKHQLNITKANLTSSITEAEISALFA